MVITMSSSGWLPAIFLLLIPILLLSLKSKKKAVLRGAKLPPSPPKLPIIGNLHQLTGLAHHSLRKLSQKYGPVMLLQLGSTPTIVISSAEAAKQVLKTRDLDCCSRPPSKGRKRFSYNFLDVAFAPYGDHWKEMRKLLVTELLSMKRVQSFAFAREAEIDKLISSISQEYSSTPVNLDNKVYALIDGIIGTVAFGKIYGWNQFKDHNFQHVLREAMEMSVSPAAEDFFPLMGRFVDVLTGLNARREWSFRQLDAFLQMVLDQHLDNPKREQENNVVAVLIRLLKEQSGTGFSITKDHIKAILFDAFLGGINTSSVTIMWAMSELVKNPRVMRKVQAEVRSSIGKKPRVDADEVDEMKYLKMVVKETFRLHPPITLLLPHEAMRQCEIGGYDILPETRIMVNVWAIGRDPKYWENPEEFYPERFEDNEIDFRGSNFELLPFGAGRRICPGMDMGSINVEFALANLLFCFDWELPDGRSAEDISLEEDGAVVTHRKTPLYLVPIRYNWQA